MPFEADGSSLPRWDDAGERTFQTPVKRFRPDSGKMAAILCVILFSIMVLGALSSILISILADIPAGRQPEPIALPEDGLTLYEENGIRLILGWNGGEITGDIPVFLVNSTGRDIYACTEGVAVNSCMVDDVFFYCEASRNTTSMSQLWIDMVNLQNLGIDAVREISLQLSIVDDDDYMRLNQQGETVSFGPGGNLSIPLAQGEPVYQTEELTVLYQGAYRDPNGQWHLRFYLQNHTGEQRLISAEDLHINGEETNLYLYQNLFPHTYAVLDQQLYDAERLQLAAPEDIRTLEFTLTVTGADVPYAQETANISVTID